MAANETTPVRLAGALVPAALAERAHSLSRRAFLAAGAAVLVLVGLIAVTSNGFGLVASARPPAHWLGPHSTRDSRLLLLARGEAQATTTVREPGGYILLARVSAPRGVRLVVSATALQPPPDRLSAVFSTYRLGRDDILLSCRSRTREKACTQGGLWGCPIEASAWRLHLVKESGPAGPVQVDFLVGSMPASLSAGQGNAWVAKFDASWPKRSSRYPLSG